MSALAEHVYARMYAGLLARMLNVGVYRVWHAHVHAHVHADRRVYVTVRMYCIDADIVTAWLVLC
jgi:hypothetical protein